MAPALLALDTGILAPGTYTIGVTVVDQTSNYPPPCQVTVHVVREAEYNEKPAFQGPAFSFSATRAAGAGDRYLPAGQAIRSPAE